MLVALGGHLLALGQPRLHPAEVDQGVAAVGLLHDAGDDLADAARVLVEDDALLGFADALIDDLLGRLRGDAPEVLGRDLLPLGHGGVDLGLFVLHLGLLPRREDELEDVDLSGLAVDLDLGERHRVRRLVVGGMEGVLQRLDEQVEGNALLLLDLAESLDRLLVHPFPLS